MGAAEAWAKDGRVCESAAGWLLCVGHTVIVIEAVPVVSETCIDLEGVRFGRL